MEVFMIYDGIRAYGLKNIKGRHWFLNYFGIKTINTFKGFGSHNQQLQSTNTKTCTSLENTHETVQSLKGPTERTLTVFVFIIVKHVSWVWSLCGTCVLCWKPVVGFGAFNLQITNLVLNVICDQTFCHEVAHMCYIQICTCSSLHRAL